METLTKCPVCETDKFQKWIEMKNGSGNYDLCNCGAAFLNPRMTEEELNLFYSSGEYRKKTEQDDAGSLLAKKQHLMRSNFILQLIGEEPIKSHLDIGCSSGELLRTVAEARPGIISMGVDIDTVLVTDEFPIVRTLEEVEGEWDLITMIQTLEHLPNPKKMLELVHERLSENGMLMIDVPNRRANMVAYVPPQHVIAYDESSLLRLMDNFFPVRTFFHGMPDGSPLDLNILQLATK